MDDCQEKLVEVRQGGNHTNAMKAGHYRKMTGGRGRQVKKRGRYELIMVRHGIHKIFMITVLI